MLCFFEHTHQTQNRKESQHMTIDTLAHWHQIVTTRNAKGLAALLADNVVFHSPVVHTPQTGKSITTLYLTAALHVFGNESFRYVREVVGECDAVLEFQVEIEGISVNGVDMIKWDDDGRIVEFKVMLRPLKAVNLIHQKMAAMLQAGA
jgi:hypothetical protein